MAESREENSDERTMKETKEWIGTLLVVATLMSTISFAAPFQIPGGVSSDTGTPLRMHSAALKAFLIADTLALCCSMSAVILSFHVHRVLFRSTTASYRFRTNPKEVFGINKTVRYANLFAQGGFISTMVAFSFALYVLVAPNYVCLAVALLMLAWAVPLVGIAWQIALFLKLSGETVTDVNHPIPGRNGADGRHLTDNERRGVMVGSPNIPNDDGERFPFSDENSNPCQIM